MKPVRIASVIPPTDRSARGDIAPQAAQDDPAFGTRQARADACTAIRTLAAVAAAQHDHHAEQAQAAAKIAQLKARLNMLKLLYASDSGKLAAAAVQIARELARAVDDYVRAGGSGLSLGGSLATDPAAPFEAGPADTAAAALAPATAAAPAPAAQAAAGPAAAAARHDATGDTGKGDTAAATGTGQTPAHAALPGLGGPNDPATVVADVHQLVRMLRDILREVERRHHAPDREQATGDLDQADAEIARVPTGYAATLARIPAATPTVVIAG
ncbi:hypothetical protein [Sphingomonas sp. CV7422]|uniref:hypothetical protein n=1 Tax=Sphingomonas sp. CV7422 TaxID=3018036 RepID=UPI0022FE84C4|nr:hypothetical protein [Sphingomonas sp. CV7422]